MSAQPTFAAAGHVERQPSLPRRFGDAIALACNWAAALAIAAIVAINGANVIGRYVFGAPIAWAEELMLYLMVLAVFAGSVTIAWRQSHIRIEALVMRLSFGTRRQVTRAVGVASVLLLLLLARHSFDVVQLMYEFGQLSDALEAPMWIPQSALTIGLLMIALMIALRLFVYDPEPQTHLGEE
ncbi:TRAP transporter small permease [Bosea sp. NPDC003192]|uniref:TRAP transporter small permease n=1 Tax=Bosea sp. NPDC003192 TaxID=3390551 RepID=UPI003D03E112